MQNIAAGYCSGQVAKNEIVFAFGESRKVDSRSRSRRPAQKCSRTALARYEKRRLARAFFQTRARRCGPRLRASAAGYDFLSFASSPRVVAATPAVFPQSWASCAYGTKTIPAGLSWPPATGHGRHFIDTSRRASTRSTGAVPTNGSGMSSRISSERQTVRSATLHAPYVTEYTGTE